MSEEMHPPARTQGSTAGAGCRPCSVIFFEKDEIARLSKTAANMHKTFPKNAHRADGRFELLILPLQSLNFLQQLRALLRDKH